MDLGMLVSGYRYGFVAVDGFSKMSSVIFTENQQPDTIIRALKKVIEHLGKPKQIYSDEERAFNSTKYIKFLNENSIKHIHTTTHSHTVERFIQTFFHNLYRRLNALYQDNSQWVNHIDNIINEYNNTDHSAMKPVDAVKKENHLFVAWHLWDSAKRDRTYSKTSENDSVRIKINQKKTAKGHGPTFTK